jgi:hypothetical protein
MTTINKSFTDKVVITFLDGVTANKTTDAFPIPVGSNTLEAFITGTGSISATVSVYGCNTKRNTNGVLLATILLAGSGSDQAGTVLTSNWGFIYIVLSAITGTGAAVTTTIGI